MTSSAPSSRARFAFSSVPVVVMTRAPCIFAIWIAALETPLPAACTSTVCPARTWPFFTTICQAVRKQSGSAAASSNESFAGFGKRFASGTTTWRE